MAIPKSDLAVIDLFAGAGGFCEAAKMAGATVNLSVEIDETCCDTLRKNRTNASSVLCEDVCRLTGAELRKMAGLERNDPVIVVGGPPCQPFSKLAYWTESGEDSRFRRARARGENVQKPVLDLGPRDDDRRDLVKEFVRLVRETRAEGFVFENVPSILHPRNRGLVDQLVDSFRSDGYQVSLTKANAADFGVAQIRSRVFILGHRQSLPTLPLPTHSSDELSLILPRHVSAGEALRTINSAEFFESEEVVVGRWAKHLKSVPPGWNYKWHTAWAGHKKPTFEAETRFWNFLLKLSPTKPSWTIAASPGPWVGPFHWDNRRLRSAELAALQGFPKGYHFCGSRRDRVRQIGNAVPPALAAAMIRQVVAAGARPTSTRCDFHSAVPTASAARVAC